MMCTFFLENIYHFHQVLKMLLDLEKVKQPMPENILLRRVRIPAQVLLIGCSGQPSHKSILVPSTEKAPPPAPACIQLPFCYLPPPAGRHYLRKPEVPTHTPFLCQQNCFLPISLQVEEEKAVFCGLPGTHFTLPGCVTHSEMALPCSFPSLYCNLSGTLTAASSLQLNSGLVCFPITRYFLPFLSPTGSHQPQVN